MRAQKHHDIFIKLFYDFNVLFILLVIQFSVNGLITSIVTGTKNDLH